MSSPLCCACRRLYVKLPPPHTLFPLPSALRAMCRAPPLSSIVVVVSIRVPSPLLRASPPGRLEAGLRGQRWPGLPLRVWEVLHGKATWWFSCGVVRAAGVLRGFKESAGHASSPCVQERINSLFQACVALKGILGAVEACVDVFYFSNRSTTLSIVLLS